LPCVFACRLVVLVELLLGASSRVVSASDCVRQTHLRRL
jgi:hypothetical protein